MAIDKKFEKLGNKYTFKLCSSNYLTVVGVYLRRRDQEVQTSLIKVFKQ